MPIQLPGALAILALATLAAAPAPAAEGDAEAGRLYYNQNCDGCHALSPSINVYAPNLHCIIGRGAGAAPFPAYTEDMKALGATGLAWTEEDLMAFLADPGAFAAARLGKPDPIIMMQVTVAAETDRRNLLAYMASRCR